MKPTALISCTLLVTLLAAAPARGSVPSDTIDVHLDSVVIEIDPQGRLVIDGRVVESDAPVVLRVHPRSLPGVPARSRGLVVHPRVEFDMRDFEDHMDDLRHFEVPDPPHPDVAPLLEGLRPQLDRLRREVRESVEHDREIRAMEQETRRLAREARQLEGAERQRAEAELRSELEALFERKMSMRRDRIDALADELREQQERFEERRQAREEIIERRLRTLLGVEDVYEW